MNETPLADGVNVGSATGADVTPSDQDPWHVGFTTGSQASRAAHWAVAVLGGVVAAAAVAAASPAGWFLPVWLVVSAVLPVLTVVDARTQLLPSVIIKPAAVLAVGAAVLLCATGQGSWTQLGLAAGYGAAAFVFYWIVWFASPPGGFGYGDVRLAGLLGFALGFVGPWAVFLGLLILPVAIGLGMFAVTATLRHASDKQPVIAFGPAMAGGAFITMFTPALFAAAVLGPLAA